MRKRKKRGKMRKRLKKDLFYFGRCLKIQEEGKKACPRKLAGLRQVGVHYVSV
jgi:hypothetical protein